MGENSHSGALVCILGGVIKCCLPLKSLRPKSLEVINVGKKKEISKVRLTTLKWKVVIDHLCGSEGIPRYPWEGGTSHTEVGAVLIAVEVSIGEERTQSNNGSRFNVGRVVINL